MSSGMTRLTFQQDASGQLHCNGRGRSSFELQVAPGEQTALQSPEQRQQDRSAGAAILIHHHDLTLKDRRHEEKRTLERQKKRSMSTREKWAYLSGGNQEQRLHD